VKNKPTKLPSYSEKKRTKVYSLKVDNEKFRSALLKNRMTVKELAERVNRSRSAIYFLLQGKTASMATIRRLENELKASILKEEND